MPDRKQGLLSWRLPALFVLALAVRVLFSQLAYPLVVADVQPSWRWENNDGYDGIATRLVDEGTYALRPDRPTAQRLPLYPLMIAALYALAPGEYVLLTQLVQALLAATTVVLLFFLGRRVAGDRCGYLAALLYALYPNSILLAARCHTEVLFTLLVTAWALVWVRAFPGRSLLPPAIGSGLLLGLALLTRGTLLLFPPWLLLTLLACKPLRTRRVALLTLCMTLVAGMTLSPWIIRNYRRSGYLFPSSTWSYAPAFHGYHFSRGFFAHGGRGLDLDQSASRTRGERLIEFEAVLDRESSPIGREWRADQLAGRFWREALLEDPVASLGTFGRGLVLVWFANFNRWSNLLGAVIHLPLLVLFVVFLWRRRRDAGPELWLLVSLILYVNALHALVYPHVRYFTPVIPLVLVLVTPLLPRLTLRGRRHRERPATRDSA
ncbi:MAG: glycosyltransferase family 39 protein [Planctomycetota bacterium]|jgi:4-amino-4-deoxy-L-arabinose transferase-like glycosyltransferase